ncbi:MAG: SPW repeat protein [Gammaproteobacteria bacterium]|nr:SPW repeat protein [Gammaproteobacteria bacterium]
MDKQRWQDWTVVTLGIYLVLAPLIGIGTIGGVAAINSYVVGTLIALIAFSAVAQMEVWKEYINIILGFWLVAAPFVLNFTDLVAPVWNQVIVGILVAGVALDAILEKPPTSTGHNDHVGHGHA